MSYYNAKKFYYYKVTKDKKEPTKLTLEGPLEGIYELKPARGHDVPAEYEFVQVIKGNPVASYRKGDLLVSKEKL